MKFMFKNSHGISTLFRIIVMSFIWCIFCCLEGELPESDVGGSKGAAEQAFESKEPATQGKHPAYLNPLWICLKWLCSVK